MRVVAAATASAVGTVLNTICSNSCSYPFYVYIVGVSILGSLFQTPVTSEMFLKTKIINLSLLMYSLTVTALKQ